MKIASVTLKRVRGYWQPVEQHGTVREWSLIEQFVFVLIFRIDFISPFSFVCC